MDLQRAIDFTSNQIAMCGSCGWKTSACTWAHINDEINGRRLVSEVIRRRPMRAVRQVVITPPYP